MKLVIDIPEGAYELLKNEGVDWLGAEHILDAVANGTPLPNNHGRLMILSEDKLKENGIDLDFSCQKFISEVGLSNATLAIIEKEGDVDEISISSGTSTVSL